MTLKHAFGNVLELAEAGEFDIVVRGCNCFNTPGRSIIARTIEKIYPIADQISNKTIQGDYNKLGNFTVAPTENFLIINAYIQYEESTGGLIDLFEYTAFELVLQKISRAYGTKRIGLPYIGTRHTGGDLERIVSMIEKFAISVSAQGGSVTLVEYGKKTISI
jgi:hypothetical protein